MRRAERSLTVRDGRAASRVENSIPRSIFALAVLVLSGIVFLLYTRDFYWDEPRLALADLMNGTAHKPYVYRVLIPGLVRWGTAVVPLSARSVAAVLMYCCLVGFVFSLRRLYGAFWKRSTFGDLVSLLSVEMLIPLMANYRHVYDFSTLLLFTLGLDCMVRARWRLFMMVYLLSCLNKETTLLLTVVCGLYYGGRLPRKQLYGLLGGQLAVYGVIRALLMWTFRNNQGEAFAYRLPENLHAVMEEPWRVATHVCLGLFVGALAMWRIRAKPAFLRAAGLGVVTVLVPLYLLFGFVLEIRVFYEAFPIAYLLCVPTMSALLGYRLEPVADTV